MHDSTEVATEMNMDLREVYIEEVTFGLEYVFEEEFIRKFRERTGCAENVQSPKIAEYPFVTFTYNCAALGR